MTILKIIILSLVSLLVLFLLTKLIGNREMSQLTMFDYIVGITIGSIAAEMATALESSFWEPLTAMVVYGLVTYLIAVISSHSIKFRKVLSGTCSILYDNKKFYIKNFKKANLDISEFLMQCRINGYFNLEEIQTVLLEPNGRISILPISTKRPVTPEDLSLYPSQEQLVFNVILDGVIIEETLKKSGNNLTWLKNSLENQGFHKLEEIFLATCDQNNVLNVYLKKSSKL